MHLEPLTAILGVPVLPILALLAGVCMAVYAFVAPERSRGLQKRLASWTERTRQKALDTTPEAAHDATSRPFQRAESGLERGTRAAREARKRAPF